VIAVFERSERRTRAWMGLGLDTDLEVVESIASGHVLDTRVGHYLGSLKQRFPGEGGGGHAVPAAYPGRAVDPREGPAARTRGRPRARRRRRRAATA
jgi:hypothetical protein